MADISLDELEARLTRAAHGALQDVLLRAGRAASDIMLKEAKTNAAARLQARSRALLNTIRSEVSGQSNAVTVSLLAGGDYGGLHVPYARLQEWGGEIVPKRAKFLAIPTEEGLTGPGIPKYASPRQMPFAKFIPGKEGSKAIWLVVDSRNDQVFFLLVARTYVPGKSYLRDALATATQQVPGLLGAEAARVVVGES